MSIRTAGIIIIGNEILSGSVKDENIHFLCNRFNDVGVRVDKIIIVGDVVNDITEEVREFSRNFDIVITCGGIGPTHDDVTYEAVSAAFNVETKINEDLINYWKSYPEENDESRRKMSSIPDTSRIIYSCIPGGMKKAVINISNVFMFPGTPRSLQARFIGLENEYFNGNGMRFHKREIYLCVDETLAISALNKTVNEFPDVSIGSYPDIISRNYSSRISLCSHELEKVIGAYEMLISLLHPSWILDPDLFSAKNKL